MTCDNNKGNICVICVIKEFPCEIKDLAREEDLYTSKKEIPLIMTCHGNKGKICKEICV
jgi:hypothetical protein